MNEEIAAGGTKMLTRKDMKKRGRHSLKKHYLMFVACLLYTSGRRTDRRFCGRYDSYGSERKLAAAECYDACVICRMLYF